MKTKRWIVGILLLALLRPAEFAYGYSVLTHEEIIDITWKGSIQPLLLARFPGTSPEALQEAHAYAYGGCIIQDLGYYPFGKRDFSDLLHYVRTGDFVTTLLNDAKDVNELAFAVGALAHYTSDTIGHPAVNQAVAVEFPKLAAKYGKSITYSENKIAHIQTEFGFDMAQVAKHRYTSDNYHSFIGFKVAADLLNRAFYETYGLKADDVLKPEDRAIESYRHSVSELIPEMTQVALRVKKQEIVKETPNFNRRQFLYNLSRANYEKEFGSNYYHPPFKARFLAFIARILPKIGPLRALNFKIPTPQAEDLYFKSINATVKKYEEYLRHLKTKDLNLANLDLDTSGDIRPGEYNLADNTYGSLLEELAKAKFSTVSPDLRSNLVAFYSQPPIPPQPNSPPADPGKWERAQKLVEQLKQTPPVTSVSSD